MTSSPLKLGFIGLGIMGAPMCGHLIAAGHQLFIHTRSKLPAALAESSATQCTTARGVAERADIVFLMLPDTPDVEAVLFAEDGVAAGLKGSAAKVVVDMSSISPVATKDFAKRIEAVAEALLFASRAGADPARVREALLGGFASSKILEVHAERMIKRTFDPGFRIALHQKDLNLALSSARQLGVSLPNTAQAQELFNSCVAHGGAAWDHSGMVRALEKMANFEVGQKAPA